MSTPDEMRWEAQRLMIEAGITTDAGVSGDMENWTRGDMRNWTPSD
jgi:hypothetical protein